MIIDVLRCGSEKVVVGIRELVDKGGVGRNNCHVSGAVSLCPRVRTGKPPMATEVVNHGCLG